MSAFQLIACTAIVLELLRDVALFIRRRDSTRALVLRAIVWLSALVAIVDPTLVTRFANLIGIGRGADVVLYVFVLAFLATAFFLYARQVRLQRQVDLLNSQIALLQPRQGAARPDSPPAA